MAATQRTVLGKDSAVVLGEVDAVAVVSYKIGFQSHAFVLCSLK